jgi:uncharacterized membrane protein YeiH
MSGVVVPRSWQGTIINILMVALIAVIAAVGGGIIRQIDSIDAKITKVEEGHKKDRDAVCADIKEVCNVVHQHDKAIDRIMQRMDDHMRNDGGNR